jgi:sortase A
MGVHPVRRPYGCGSWTVPVFAVGTKRSLRVKAMRRTALALIASGVGIALAGGSLGFASWQGQRISRTQWEGEDHEPGAPELWTRIAFPSRGGQDCIVMDGASEVNLLRGPVRVEWAAEPGEHGNCIIAAHRDTQFRILQELKRGDQITLERSGQIYRYQVVALQVVRPDDTSFYQPTQAPVLTLVTCYPFSYFGKAPQRFIVRAELLQSNT